jgi:hypothetical protein
MTRSPLVIVFWSTPPSRHTVPYSSWCVYVCVSAVRSGLLALKGTAISKLEGIKGAEKVRGPNAAQTLVAP